MELSNKGFRSLLVVSLMLNLWPNVACAKEQQRNAAPPSAVNSSAAEPKKSYEIKLKILDAAAREKLLNTRMNSNLGDKFGAFSNMFFVRSKLDTDTCVGLSSDVEGISERELMPAFPSSYKCTLKELLDVIALQTNTKWIYRQESQVMGADSSDKKTADGIAIFSFVAADVKPQFDMTAAKGWKKIEHSSWTMFVPPTAPVGMDFHVGGKLSAETPEKLKELHLFEAALPPNPDVEQMIKTFRVREPKESQTM
ncbi:hypothetical protein KBI23_01995 [bacterium]|nr:hypothetical protein [bacterium]MBP9808803.1 hypothetical protein [bacterium]